MAVLVSLALLAAACGSGTSDLLEAAEDAEQATADPGEATPDPSPEAEPTPEPTATSVPIAAAEPTPTSTPEPVETLIAVFADGAIDFDGVEANLRARYGGDADAAAVSWFEARGVIPADVEEVHQETLTGIDADFVVVMVPLMQISTVYACEAGALGFSATQFADDMVSWSLSLEDGESESIEVATRAVAVGSIIAADEFCPADSPSFASGDPQMPVTTPSSSGVTDDNAGFVGQAAAAAGCSLLPTQKGPLAGVDYPAALLAIGLIETRDEADEFLPLESTRCTVGDSSGLTFWKYGDPSGALLASQPILLSEPDPGGPCWAVSGYFEYLVFGFSAPGSSPSAVDSVNALASFDAPLVASGGDCG